MLKNKVQQEQLPNSANELPLLNFNGLRSASLVPKNNRVTIANNEIELSAEFYSEPRGSSEFEPASSSVISLNPSSQNTLIYGVERQNKSKQQTLPKQTPKQVFNTASYQIKRRKSSARELNSVGSGARRLSSFVDTTSIVNETSRTRLSRVLTRQPSLDTNSQSVQNLTIMRKMSTFVNSVGRKSSASVSRINAINNKSAKPLSRALSVKRQLVASEATNWLYLFVILLIVIVVSLLFVLLILLICYNRFNRICYSLS